MKAYTKSKDRNQSNGLVISGIPAGKGFLLIFLIPLTIGLFFVGRTVYEAWTKLRLDNIDRVVELLGVVMLFNFLSLFWVLIGRQFLPQQERQTGRIQHVHKRKSAVNHMLGLLVFTPLAIIGGLVVYQFLYPAGVYAPDWEMLMNTINKNRGGVAFGSIFVIIFVLIYVASIMMTIRKIVQSFRHSRVTATFNKERYLMGNEVKVSIKDGMSSYSDFRYRVHLNFVEEHEKTTGRGKNRSTQVVRDVCYNEHQDVSATELSRGLTFLLPTPEEASDFKPNIDARREASYWEVIAEEVDGHFWVRFFVPM